VESSGDAIITKSLDGIITSWNKGAEQIHGYSAEEVVGKPISILEPSMLVEETKELTELIKQGDRIHNYETLRLRKDGTIINVSLTLSPVYDTPGELTAISVIARNITKSKNAEKELQQSEERYRLITEQTGQMVYDYDLKTNKNKWAGAIEEVTGYNFEEFQKLGKDFWTENILDSDPNRAYEKSQDKKTGDRFKEELRLRRKDGTYGYIENSGVYLMDNDGQSYRAIGVLRDITEKREAEEALKKIDKMRIKEIHHRIKNNLQVISSLLDLEANKFSDEKILESFKESRNRVVSMALIHQELYKGDKFETLDFGAYLQKLSADLFNSYRLGNDNISLNLDLEKVYLDMDTAVPLGIIVNELVSNALKHAFPARKEGEIQINLCKKGNFSLNLEYSGVDADCKEEESFQYLLAVEDNGKGIPEEIQLQNTDSLGLQLVNILVEQIDGQIELKRDKGTKFTILFSNIER
jgi:PAS domain S-box-containing protein